MDIIQRKTFLAFYRNFVKSQLYVNWTRSRVLNNFTNFFVRWNFSEFLPCNNTKKGWPCFAWVVFAKSITCWKQTRRRGGWDMIINSLRTLPYGRGLYAKYTNKTHHDLSNTNRGCVRQSLHILQWTSKQSFGTFVNPDPLQAFW